jgi:hypothetical protein
VCAALVLVRGWAAGLRAVAWFTAGLIAGLLPYAWWLWSGWSDLVQQQRYVSDRYDVLSFRYYVDNVLHEWRRYGGIGRGLLAAQPGAWLLAICGVVGLWTLWRGRDRQAVGPRVLRVALLVGAGLFALGVKPKAYYYLAALWPLLALTAAAGLEPWLRTPSRILRIAAIVLLTAAIGDGLRGWHRVTLGAAGVTSYRALCERLAARIPPDSRVIALPQYWFGLEPHVREYRSFFVPMLFASPRFAAEHAPHADLLAGTRANVLLLDPPMLTFLSRAFDPGEPAHEYVAAAVGLRDYVTQRSERRVVLEDPSYGRFEIHFLRAATPQPARP